VWRAAARTTSCARSVQQEQRLEDASVFKIELVRGFEMMTIRVVS
jgi:hypothetical protein